MHFAAWNGSVEVTKLLIAAGADKNALNRVSIIDVYNLYIVVHRYYTYMNMTT